MRLIILIALIFFGEHLSVYAQIPKDMQSQMKAIANELNKQIAELEKNIVAAKNARENPEVIKDMEEQLAMLKKQQQMIGGVSKNLGRIPDKVVKQAVEKDSLDQLMLVTVPKLDKKRIAMIPKESLSDSQLIVFVKNVHAEVNRIIPKEDKEKADSLYAIARLLKKTPNQINNIATNLWASGYPEQAICLLGQSCAANPENGNNMSNYAAFLTMAGAEHAAIPILQNLGNKYSGNSTVANNMGQAWYALGDMTKAKQLLNKAIATHTYHSQANQTLCWILKSEGKDKEAIAALKRSIQEVYTSEKDHLLVKLGDSLKFRDFRFPYPGKPGTVEQLGMNKFILAIPDYPFEGGATAQTSWNEWHNFREKVIAAKNIADQKLLLLQPLIEAHQKRLMADPTLLKPFNNHIHITAKSKMKALINWSIYRMLEIDKEYKVANDSVKAWRKEFEQSIQNVEDCGARKSAASAFVFKSNMLYKGINNRHLSLLKAYYNTFARLSLYFATDESEYQALIESSKTGFLISLLNLPCIFEVGCIPSGTPAAGQNRPLPDFDSVNCNYKDKIFIPPFTTITIECNTMTTDVDVGTENLFEAFEIKIKLGMVENLNSGKITKGTMELGVESGISGTIGPIEGSLKGGVATGIEITRDGVKEVYIKTSMSAEWTAHVDEIEPKFVDEPTITTKGTPLASGDLKVSWNAGPKGDWGFENSSTSATGSSSVSEFKNLVLKLAK